MGIWGIGCYKKWGSRQHVQLTQLSFYANLLGNTTNFNRLQFNCFFETLMIKQSILGSCLQIRTACSLVIFRIFISSAWETFLLFLKYSSLSKHFVCTVVLLVPFRSLTAVFAQFKFEQIQNTKQLFFRPTLFLSVCSYRWRETPRTAEMVCGFAPAFVLIRPQIVLSLVSGFAIWF